MDDMGKPKVGLSSGLHSLAVTLVLFLLLAATSPVTATPPRRREQYMQYVQWEKIKQLSIQFFPKEADPFIKLEEFSFVPAMAGSGRQGLKSEGTFYDKIVQLVIPSLMSQQAPKVKTYFQKISDSHWIEGRRYSPKFSEDTSVRIELILKSSQEYQVDFQEWARGKKGKTPVFRIPFFTGIRILPVYDKGDVFVFNSVNQSKIRNSTWDKRYGPENPASFIIERDMLIREIATLHWPYEQGKRSGPISLKREDSSFLGPWETEAWPRYSGHNSVAWVCHPDLVLNPGTYEIVDSDPVSWQNNDQSDRRGMSWVIASPPK